jgi:hypothetical protein
LKINVFNKTWVIENEILTVVNNITNMQYKYFTNSIMLMRLPKIINSKINQPKNPKKTRNVLFRWYLISFGEIIA